MFWRWFYTVGITVQSILLLYLFFYGAIGWHKIPTLQERCSYNQKEVEQREQEVAQLKKELNSWLANPFYKEKVAREQLQMARADDIVFYR
jgi:cell division protein FtsB